MPKNTIASTFVDNGPTDQHTNSLLIAWGPKGGAPDAPGGWVNAGYAHLCVSLDPHNGQNPDSDHYVVLDEPAMDHLISTLRRIRRKTFRAPSRLDLARERALTDNTVDDHLKSVGLG